MKELLKILPILLNFIVGIISLIMALKSLFTNRLLAFQENAAHKSWNDIDISLQVVILTLLRITGLGFLIIAILLMIFPVINYFTANHFYSYSLPFLALLYCTGLFVFNYILYRKTKTNTPWKGSVYAMIALMLGIIISIFN
jgi:hypothetical protein